MTTRVVRKDTEKRELEKELLLNLLMDMIKEEDNRYCVDCDAKGPRWASWNLGLFLCIRCAGIHRKLGVHISKVKSINLDSWTPEQVQSMRVMGNSIARAVYEAHLPDQFRRPQSDQSLEAFVRAKYEQKRYVMKDWVKPKVDPLDLPINQELQDLWKHGTVRVKTGSALSSGANKSSMSSSIQRAPAPVSKPAPVKAQPATTAAAAAPVQQKESALSDLVDLTIHTPAAAASNVQQPQTASQSAVDDLLGLSGASAPGTIPNVASAPQLAPSATAGPNGSQSNTDMLFGEFASHQASATATPVNDGTKSNKDIMALYANLNNNNTNMGYAPPQQQQVQTPFGLAPAPQGYAPPQAVSPNGPFAQHQPQPHFAGQAPQMFQQQSQQQFNQQQQMNQAFAGLQQQFGNMNMNLTNAAARPTQANNDLFMQPNKVNTQANDLWQ